MNRNRMATVLVGVVAGCTPRPTPPENRPEPEPQAVVDESDSADAEANPPGQSKLKGEEVSYEGGGKTLKGFVVYDESVEGPRPGVIVVHEWWGHNDYSRNRARQLAEMGYTALALDLYGDGKRADHPDDAMKFAQQVMSDQEIAAQRFRAAMELLVQHPTTDPDRISAIGYCFGGSVVLEMARRGMDLDVVGAFHAGALQTSTEMKKGAFDGKILVANGGEDRIVTPEAIEAFKQEMDGAEVDYTFISYPGALHGFTNPQATALGKKFDRPLAYDEEADQKSWAELTAMLDQAY